MMMILMNAKTGDDNSFKIQMEELLMYDESLFDNTKEYCDTIYYNNRTQACLYKNDDVTQVVNILHNSIMLFTSVLSVKATLKALHGLFEPKVLL